MKLNLKLNSSLLLIISVVLLSNCKEEQPKPNPQPKGISVVTESELTFMDLEGDSITTIGISIADLPEERNQGLMDVYNLPENVGMLFIFDDVMNRSFWMANTPLPLDIMYVGNDSTIVRIYQSTTPFSQTSLPSEAPARFVVETNGGFSLTHGISEGMKIKF